MEERTLLKLEGQDDELAILEIHGEERVILRVVRRESWLESRILLSKSDVRKLAEAFVILARDDFGGPDL